MDRRFSRSLILLSATVARGFRRPLPLYGMLLHSLLVRALFLRLWLEKIVLRNLVVAEVCPYGAIGRSICIPTRDCLGVNAHLVYFDNFIIDQCRVGETHVILGVQEEENLDLFDFPNHHFHWLITFHRIMKAEEGCIKLP